MFSFTSGLGCCKFHVNIPTTGKIFKVSMSLKAIKAKVVTGQGLRQNMILLIIKTSLGDIANELANYGLFTHPVDTAHH